MLPEDDDNLQTEVVETAETETKADAPATSEEAGTEAARDGSEETEGKKPKPQKSAVDKAFARNRRQMAHMERENLALRRQLDQVTGRLDQLDRSSLEAPPSETGPPDPAKFGDDWDAYNKAVVDYTVRQHLGGVLGQLKEGQKQARQQQAQEQAQQGIAKKFESIYRAGKAEIDDFDDIRDVEFPASQTMLQAIPSGIEGARVLHHLATDPDEAERIMSLPEGDDHKREIWLLAHRLANVGKKVTEAKKPVKSEGGGTGAGAKNPDKLSDDAWFREWKAKEAKKRGFG